MVKKIQAAIKNLNIDGILLQSPHNRRYATGIQTSAGVCLILKEQAYFITDFRYIHHAQNNAKDFTVLELKGDAFSMINDLVLGYTHCKLAFEESYVTVSTFDAMKKALTADLVKSDGLLEELRKVKTPSELALLRSAQGIGEKAYGDILDFIQIGRSEKEIAAHLTYLLLRHGGQQVSFDPIVASGPNSAMPHAEPTERTIQVGDFITMDFGCIYQGYCGDMTRTVAVGSYTDEMAQVYATVLAAQEAGIAAVEAGVFCRDADLAARSVIEAGGYGDFFGHSFGHGVGLVVHEGPNLSPKSEERLAVGHVVSAEPGVYLPESFGVRIEDLLVVTATGRENLNHSEKNLITL